MSTSLTFDILARDRASDKFDKVGNSADWSSGKLKKFAAVGAAAVAAGAIVAAKALWDMGKAGMADEAAQQRLATTLRNATGATDKQIDSTESWITAQGKALGFTDDELRPALGRLAGATGDLDKAQWLASLAMDVSAGKGKSLTSVTEALTKAQNGSLTGLSRLGVATKNADGSTKSLKQVTQDLAALHGGQAATAAETAQGKFGRLKVMYDETKESIGSKLLPVAERLADWMLTDGADGAQKLGSFISEKVLPPLKDMWTAISPVLIPALKTLGTILGEVLPPLFQAVVKWVSAVATGVTALWNNALQPVFKFMASAIATVLEKLGSMFSTLGSIKGAPGWIAKTGEALNDAAAKAQAVADNINKIPTKKYVNIYVSTITTEQAIHNATHGAGGAGKAGDPRMSLAGVGGAGGGGGFSPSGRVPVEVDNSAQVGLLERIENLLKDIKRDQLKDGAELKLTGQGSGQKAHLRGAW